MWHEFAHQIDMLDRSTNGTPPLADPGQRRRWHDVMTAEYEQLIADAEAGRATLLDTYGADSEAEFFAVATECFFDCPVELRDEHPRLYELLRDYYRQDPAARLPAARERSSVRAYPKRPLTLPFPQGEGSRIDSGQPQHAVHALGDVAQFFFAAAGDFGRGPAVVADLVERLEHLGPVLVPFADRHPLASCGCSP